MYLCLWDFQFKYQSAYWIMCVLGLYVHYFFFAFLLTDFFNNELLKNVLKAIIEPAASLALTLCVMLYFIYSYTLFAYW